MNKELEKDNLILIKFIKEKLPEYTEWLELNFGNRGENETKLNAPSTPVS